MDLASWSLGLALIVMTIAIHTTGVVLMAFALQSRIRVRVDPHKPDRLRAVPIVIAHIGAVALMWPPARPRRCVVGAGVLAARCPRFVHERIGLRTRAAGASSPSLIASTGSTRCIALSSPTPARTERACDRPSLRTAVSG